MGKCGSQLNHRAGTIYDECVTRQDFSRWRTNEYGLARGRDERAEPPDVPDMEFRGEQLTVWPTD